MKMKVEQAVASAMALKELGKIKFPIGVSLNIAKNSRNLSEVGKVFDERRTALGEKYGEKNERGFTLKPDKIDAFSKEERVLRDEEVEVDVVVVHLDDLKVDGKLPDVEPNILEPLDWMIDATPRKRTKSRRSS